MKESGKPSPKLASRLAGKIGQHIIDDGWRVGAFLGTEADLVARYGVSRWTVRDAIAIAERDGLVERRRGNGGGLFVAAPAGAAVSAAIRNYFEFAHVRIDDVLVARHALEELALSLACARIAPAQIDALRSLIANAVDCPDDALAEMNFALLGKLLEATHSTVLKVFVESLSQLTVVAGMHSSLSQRKFAAALRELLDLRIRQTAAVIASDTDRLRPLLSAHRELTATTLKSSYLLRNRIGTRMRAPTAPTAGATRSETIARQMQAEIIAAGWSAGHHLGAEAELAAHYNVSQLVFREVVRLLEEHGVVQMRKGRDSGLKVGAPRPAVVIGKAKVYLLYAGVDREDIHAVQAALETALVEAMAVGARHMHIGETLHAIAAPPLAINVTALAERVEQFYREFLDCGENPVAEVFLSIFLEMFTLRRGAAGFDDRLDQTVAGVRAQQLAIAAAIRTGDAARACRALNRLRADVLEFELRYKSAARIIAGA